MCFQFLLHFTTYFLQHSFMDERLPGKIETEPQYVIKFFAQWKLVIDTIKPLASESSTEGMNSITKKHLFQRLSYIMGLKSSACFSGVMIRIQNKSLFQNWREFMSDSILFLLHSFSLIHFFFTVFELWRETSEYWWQNKIM